MYIYTYAHAYTNTYNLYIYVHTYFGHNYIYIFIFIGINWGMKSYFKSSDLVPFLSFYIHSIFCILYSIFKWPMLVGGNIYLWKGLLSWYTKGRELLKSHGLSETPTVWTNTSDTFTPRWLGFNQFLVSAIKRFDLKKCVMVNCVVPVLADNPLAYNLLLVSL